MKKMKKVMLLPVFAIALFLSGCTSYYRDAGADFLTRPDSLSGAQYYTEFEVNNQRISAQGDAAVLLGIFQIADNKRCLSIINPNLSVFSILSDILSPTYTAIANAKSIALYNACVENNADQLIGVTFDYVVKNYFFYATVDCRVKGFPAKVKGVKMVEKKPIILNKWQKIEYVKPYENPVVDKQQAQPSFSFDFTK